MFCPAGYVTLAELWKEFFARYRVPLTRFAMQKYGQSDFQLGETFGSPDDYCEDVFLSTLAKVPVFAAAADGRVARLVTEIDEGYSKLFAKMSPFESYLAASDPAEAGMDGYWLRKFGSDHFEAWDVTRKTLNDWKAHFAAADGEVSERACFHTLPFVFERARYVVPDDAPPWICDVIDEHSLPRTIAAFSGMALCMADKAACTWRDQVLKAPELPQLGNLTWQKRSTKGRPNKTESILRAYSRLYPDGHNVPWKEVVTVLEKETGQSFSEKSLRRAIAMSASAVSKSADGVGQN